MFSTMVGELVYLYVDFFQTCTQLIECYSGLRDIGSYNPSSCDSATPNDCCSGERERVLCYLGLLIHESPAAAASGGFS
jgi:hypothetical protein